MLHAEGPLLSIDLTERTVETENVDDVLESFIGGRGLATALAHDRIPFDADPLGPENRLYLATGPMQVSIMSFTGRMNATAVSPLTDGLASSNAGGFMSRNFADTGYSAVELAGESDELVILHVTDEGVEFESVPQLEGAEVPEVTDYIEDAHDLGPEHTAVIGPAGEHAVRFASIMTSETRAFGRGGLGAVLGSKGVKGITFEGDSRPTIEIPDEASEVHREAAQSDHIMKRQGTTSATSFANYVEALPTRYFSERSFEGADAIGGEAIEEVKYKKGTCSACAFACKLPTRDEASGLETEGPEYETVMAFGSNAGVDDLLSIMKSNDLCDRFGLDTISAGNTIAAYLSAEDEFGNSELIHELTEKIAYREGIGERLAEGIDRVHDELGVENWTVKGLDFAAHDGRHLNGQGLSYAVSNRGADHMYGMFYAWEYPFIGEDGGGHPTRGPVDPEGLAGKPELILTQENSRAIEDSAVICRFSRDFMSDPRVSTLLDADYDDLQTVGHRIVTLERHFNNQRGFDRGDDDLPYELPGFEAALDEYYQARGWNDDGTVPEDAVA
jgi:aldehyde:ferredoxin oxidoreductase